MLASKYSETDSATVPEDDSAAASLEKTPEKEPDALENESEGFDVPEGFPGEVGDTVSVRIVEGPDGQRQFEPVKASKSKSWSKENLQKEMA